MLHRIRAFFFFLFTVSSAFSQSKSQVLPYLQLVPSIDAINNVMIHDVVAPPVAARYYTYAMLGAYNFVADHSKNGVPLSRLIKSFDQKTSISIPSDKYDYRIAAMYCILETMKLMLPSGYQLDEVEKKYLALLVKYKIPAPLIEASVKAAIEMCTKTLDYAKNDRYRNLSARLRYTPVKGDQYWYPTPPMYMEAVEPNWKTVRPMILDSATQFKPVKPITFSKDSSSRFYKEAMDVYKEGKAQNQNHLIIASFWDCNPFAVTTSGHMMIGFKKISPGGHWMNITGIVCKTAHLSFENSVVLYTAVAAAQMDAFIANWDEKYRRNSIRPETYINRYIDVNWVPALQTPPFPEYPSGHATLSNAEARVLSYFMGDHFTYTDNSEIPYGVGPRTFHSFQEAANEASISRFYGGIHFMDAILNGNKQGQLVGDFVVQRLKEAGIPAYQK